MFTQNHIFYKLIKTEFIWDLTVIPKYFDTLILIYGLTLFKMNFNKELREINDNINDKLKYHFRVAHTN